LIELVVIAFFVLEAYISGEYDGDVSLEDVLQNPEGYAGERIASRNC